MKRIFPLLILLLLTASSCIRKAADTTADGSELAMRHARLLSVKEHKGYVTVSITDPWDSTHVLHRYVLVPRDQAMPASLPEGDMIRTPVTSAAVYTSVHCGLLDELGAYNCIKGICDLRYINLKKVHDDVKRGAIRDLGETMTPNIEAIMELRPDVILLSPFENSGTYGKTGKMGIPLIECADYMEASPLARAEWMRFYGMLFGCSEKADSLFSDIERNYNETKRQAASVKSRPTVVTEMKIGSTWYVAGGMSTVGILISDAGGDYVFKDVRESGALPYSPEKVYEKAREADYWLIKYNQGTDMTLADLRSMWSMNARMKAYSTKSIYCCNLSSTHFFEETPFHPDVLLREYVNILHPELREGELTLKYYKQVKE